MNASRSLFAAALVGASLLLPLAPAQAAPTETTRAGSTTVVLSKEFTDALGALAVKPAPVSPGRLFVHKWKGTRAVFPITTGAVDLGTAKAEIAHGGGLSLSAAKGTIVVELTSFIIDLAGPAPVLTGLVTANDSLVGRLKLFELSLPANALDGTNEDFLKVSDVAVTLHPDAAAALSAVFGTTVPAGLSVGTASVRAVLEIERH